MTEDEIRASVAGQGALRTIGVVVERVEEGRVYFLFDHADAIAQQDGFVHAGMMTAAVDSACGYAAATRMAPGRNVLTIEFKVNFLKPARAARYRCEGLVLRAGRTITVCEGRVTDAAAGTEFARMQATMIAVDRPTPAG